MAAVATAGNGNWNSTTPNAPWPGGTVPASTDTITIGHAVVINQNVTAGSDPGFGGTAAIAITAAGALSFDTTASRTVTLYGDLTMASGASLLIGAAGAGRVPVGTVITIIFNASASMARGKYGMRVAYSTTSVFKAYGLSHTNNTYTTQADNSGQKVINVNDVTGWAAGDIIEIGGINAVGGAGSNGQENTIVSIATKAVTLTTDLGVTHPANSYVINKTKNIVLKSNDTTNGWFANLKFGTASNFVLDNVEIDTTGQPSTAITGCVGFSINGNTAAETSTGTLQNCTFYKAPGGSAFLLQLSGPYGIGATVTDCSFFNGTGTPAVYCYGGYIQPIFTNCIIMKSSAGLTILNQSGQVHGIFTNIWFNGCTTAIVFNNVGGIDLVNCKFDGNGATGCLSFGTGFVAVDMVDTGSTYGTINNNGAVFAIAPNTYPKFVGVNQNINSSETLFLGTGLQNYLSALTYIQQENATVGGDSNVFARYINSGSFYKDLTTQKNSVSSIRLDTLYAGTSTYAFTFLAKTGVAYLIKGNMQYNADYDNAAYTLPSVTVSGLGIVPVVVTATAAADEAWEAFSINVTQSSGSDGLLTVTFSGQSATATGSAYFDGIVAPPFITAARFYGYKFDETTPTRTVNSYVVAAEATALAYAGIAIDWTAKTLVITTAHTMQEIYDYCQAQMSAAANLTKSEFLSTTDGLNYTLLADWDFTVTNVAVTATGQHVYMSGTGAWSVTGASGDFTGILTDATQTRVKINVTDIVAGSRIQVYDVDDTTELANEIVAGTSFSLAFTHTADHDIRIRLSYVDGDATAYYWHTQTNTVTNTGITFVAVQESNDIYINNGVDGSAVTECSVSGVTIRIYVDDPDNTTTAQRIYNWYQYYLFSEEGIREQDGAYVTAIDSTHIVFADTMKIINQDTANPLNLTGANITHATGAATNIFDLTNGASICLNFNRVEGLSLNTTLARIEKLTDDNQALIISM